ncbi:MAG: DUF421 domain-containing protein [Chloroflexi bacterium]|nr:DUF421 domain-containing protein [Chloroflexota bacterium]
MDDIFWPSVSFAEKALRPAIIYLFLVVAFRLMGKREVGQFTPFDLIVLLTISNILQNAMIGNDTSLLGGITGAVTILALNRLLNWLLVVSPRRFGFLEDAPTVLIENGQIRADALRKELVTFSEIYAALRKHGVDDVAEVKQALLEIDGTISVLLRRAQDS